jgi:hypothetical protein
MKPSWWDWIVYRYFMRRWKPWFKKSVQFTAMHFSEIETARGILLPERESVESDSFYYEEK